MAQTSDRMLISETAWQKGVSREVVIRPIVFVRKLTGQERLAACRQLGLKPTRFYQLLAQFRRKPVTSSLLDEAPGPEKGRRLLSPEQEDAVDSGIQGIYCRRERPTITAVHDHVRVICRQRNLPAPSWKAVKVRIDRSDQKKLALDEAFVADPDLPPDNLPSVWEGGQIVSEQRSGGRNANVLDPRH
jgi:putative transposase